jgi:hypothetical protein
LTFARSRLDPVTNRILDQWLQNQTGYKAIGCVWRDIHSNEQPIVEAYLLNFKIGRQEAKFIA